MPETPPDALTAFEQLARGRRAVRQFADAPLPEGVLDRLLDCARWAPSGYNLQPTQLVVVEDAKLKGRLCEACLGQRQVAEAPATVVFVGDRDVIARNFDRVLAAEREAGSMNDGYEAFLRKLVPLAFGRGPAGLGALAKGAYVKAARPFKPVPDVPAAAMRFWLTKQVMLGAMNFMLAASAAGLGTVPMEGFDESRVKAVCGIPSRHVVPVVIPVGVPADGELKKTRLPLEELVHRDRWSGR
jgi:nitroreductase